MGIERIGIGAFCGVQQVSRLLLENNKLTSLPSLCPLKCCLMLLLLNNNDIGLVSNDSFKSLKKLREIYLSRNNLVQLPNLHWIRHSLVTFEASDNDIQSLDMIEPFGIFEVLNSFDVTGNNIRHFNVSILRQMPQLKWFYIPRNKISHIEDFRTLYDEQIYLSNNPWHCGAELSWMGEVDMNFERSLKCATPDCLCDRAIADMGEFLTLATDVFRVRYITKLNVATFNSITYLKQNTSVTTISW